MRTRPTAVRRLLAMHGRPLLPALLLAVAVTACGEGEPPPSDPGVVWAAAEAWSHEGGMVLGDDWAYSIEAAETLPEELIQRVANAAARIDGGLRLLVVTRPGCMDSAHSIPYLSAVAAAVPEMEMRAVDPGMGRALMEAHPTPDGRAATPTVLLLDDLGEVRGCWIERPAPLQYWYLENPEGLGRLEKFSAKTEWYEADRGVHAVAEFAHIVEMAAEGTVTCGLPMDSVAGLPEPGQVPPQVVEAGG